MIWKQNNSNVCWTIFLTVSCNFKHFLFVDHIWWFVWGGERPQIYFTCFHPNISPFNAFRNHFKFVGQQLFYLRGWDKYPTSYYKQLFEHMETCNERDATDREWKSFHWLGLFIWFPLLMITSHWIYQQIYRTCR